MITLVLWAELLIELGIATLAAWLLVHRFELSALTWCLPIVIFLVLRMLAVLVISVLSWCLRDRLSPPLSVGDRISMIWHEALALIRVYLLMLSELKFTKLKPVTTRESQSSQSIVVLLHGVYCNRGIWRPWLQRFAAQTDCIFMAPNLGPVMSSVAVQARHFARWLDSVIDARSQQRVILVGHSMGGLIARLCVERALLTKPVHKLICIGTPHAGSRLADYALGAVGRDLRINSVALTELHNVNRDATAPVVNLYSKHDTFVVPYQSAHLAGAMNESVDGVGHLSLLYSPAVQAAVLRELRTA